MCVPEDDTQVVGIQKEEHRIVLTKPKKQRSSHVTAALKSTPLLRSLIHQEGEFDFDELPRLLRLSVDIHKVLKTGGGYFPELSSSVGRFESDDCIIAASSIFTIGQAGRSRVEPC
ncbi:hypothetical protein SASPL_117789 [Salvia splendens]|uniref:Uncharacterized protein n=1 Tax=Salvia splendens TaxID=180675 RepID=A0A8X8XYK6_SALSN|nr:hypothetical protein SASPL_117789 [Salvia splendens]